jgi:hypothetical protein
LAPVGVEVTGRYSNRQIAQLAQRLVDMALDMPVSCTGLQPTGLHIRNDRTPSS